jgi:hypothetical protein
MSFESKAQAAFAHANPEKFGGEKALEEWDAATDFKHLPERKHPKKPKAKAPSKPEPKKEVVRMRHTAQPR